MFWCLHLTTSGCKVLHAVLCFAPSHAQHCLTLEREMYALRVLSAVRCIAPLSGLYFVCLMSHGGEQARKPLELRLNSNSVAVPAGSASVTYESLTALLASTDDTSACSHTPCGHAHIVSPSKPGDNTSVQETLGSQVEGRKLEAETELEPEPAPKAEALAPEVSAPPSSDVVQHQTSLSSSHVAPHSIRPSSGDRCSQDLPHVGTDTSGLLRSIDTDAVLSSSADEDISMQELLMLAGMSSDAVSNSDSPQALSVSLSEEYSEGSSEESRSTEQGLSPKPSLPAVGGKAGSGQGAAWQWAAANPETQQAGSERPREGSKGCAVPVTEVGPSKMCLQWPVAVSSACMQLILRMSLLLYRCSIAWCAFGLLPAPAVSPAGSQASSKSTAVPSLHNPLHSIPSLDVACSHCNGSQVWIAALPELATGMSPAPASNGVP